MRILGFVPRGSGAAIIHETLASSIEGYEVRPYDPRLEYFPPLLIGKRQSADIIHAPPDHAALTAHRKSPLVITFHGYFLDPAMRPYSSFAQRVHYRTDLRWLTRRAVSRATVVTAVSRQTRDLVCKDLGFQGEIHVIPNGVDIGRFCPRPEAHRNVRVLFCGNISKRRGGHLLFAVAERLRPGVELMVAAGLRNRQKPFHSDNVHWLGRVPPPEMPALYNRADILFHPSIREGLSLAVAEAMASGLPVVTSSAPSLAELVHDGQGGYLCPHEDVKMFAERIDHLAKQPELRASMGRYNRARIENGYRRDQMVDGYKEIFRGIAGS